MPLGIKASFLLTSLVQGEELKMPGLSQGSPEGQELISYFCGVEQLQSTNTLYSDFSLIRLFLTLSLKQR